MIAARSSIWLHTFWRNVRPTVRAAAAWTVMAAAASAASTKEERLSAWGIFLAAKENLVNQCLYKPKPDEVVWGALAGLQRELGPDYNSYFPQTRSGSVDQALDTYERTLHRLEAERHIPIKTLVEKSVRAYCRSLDRYSDYDNFETWSKIRDARKFNKVGVGMSLLDDKERGFILHPLSDGPAERAGLVDGDLLIEANGEPVLGLSKEEISVLCAGPEGTSVRFKVRHGDTSEETLNVVREKYVLSPLSVEQNATGVRVSCREISPEAVEDLRNLLRTLRPDQELTLDFRGCGMGTVRAATMMASLFLPADSVIGRLETVKGQEKLISENKTPFRPAKLTLLQDRLTASSAELIIVALAGHPGLKVETRGERTYGKGVTGVPVAISADASGKLAGVLLITDTRMYGPNNELWEGEGLAPTTKGP